MLHNMWPLVLGQKPLKCQEKPSGVYKMQQTTGADPAGELTALPRPRSWWGSRSFRPRASSVWARLSPPRIFNPLRSKILHTALCEMKLFRNYYSFCRRPPGIILFRLAETCVELFQNYFGGTLQLAVLGSI